MSLTRLFFGPPTKKIGGITIDAFVQEVHKHNADVTQYPVETGADISDHIIDRPLQLELRGISSSITIGLFDFRFPNHHFDVWNQLNSIMTNRETTTVVTGLKVYDNMAITSIRTERDKSINGAIDFYMTLQELRIVQSLSVAIANVLVGGAPPTNLQALNPADVGKTVGGQGLLTDIIQRANGLIDTILPGL